MNEVRNVALVHGGFVDGSGWEGVYHLLKQDGSTSASCRTRPSRWRATSPRRGACSTQQDGPDDPRRALLRRRRHHRGRHARRTSQALVYIAAFAPDQGESVAPSSPTPRQERPVPPILPPQDGFLLLDRTSSPASFAADVARRDQAAFMADSQVPWGVEALGGTISDAGVADQAELVPRRHRRPHDPAAGAALDGRAHRRDGHRSSRQPRHLRLAARRRGRRDHAGGGVAAQRSGIR